MPDQPVTKQHFDEIYSQFDRALRKMERSIALLFVALLLLGGWSLLLQIRAGAESKEIQQQRIGSIEETCLEENHKNAKLEAFLTALDTKKSTARHRRAEYQFVQAIAPRRNCAARVKRFTVTK